MRAISGIVASFRIISSRRSRVKFLHFINISCREPLAEAGRLWYVELTYSCGDLLTNPTRMARNGT